MECIGACTGAPAMQINYEFYENLTVERTTQIFEGTQRTGTKASGAIGSDFRFREAASSCEKCP